MIAWLVADDAGPVRHRARRAGIGRRACPSRTDVMRFRLARFTRRAGSPSSRRVAVGHNRRRSFDNVDAWCPEKLRRGVSNPCQTLRVVSSMLEGRDGPCLICQEHRGEVALPGGPLISDENVVAFHCPPLPTVPRPYLGYLFATSRRHVASFAELEMPEAAAMGVAIAALSAALQIEGAQRVYVLTIGHAWPHLHVHLVPRWPETPPDVSWMNVDEWAGARRGGAVEVAAMTRRLRSRVATAMP